MIVRLIFACWTLMLLGVILEAAINVARLRTSKADAWNRIKLVVIIYLGAIAILFALAAS